MKNYEATEQAYKNGYEAGVKDAHKWIPVTERLPSASVDRIIVTDIEYPDRLPRVVRRKAVTEEEFWGVTIGFFAHGVKFTHWMPLPEPPKGA